ncbi:MAG: hypothetical protein KDE27_13285 [Planctomycetes bacterium]|nr:hypothetical protein [Planctomycetota bacterium]
MSQSLLSSLAIGAGFGAVFLLGQWLPRAAFAEPAALAAQGRGPVNPPAPKSEPTTNAGSSSPEIVYTEGGGGSGSANGFVAVTGSYGVGTSVLYVLDTQNRQLAVYEARGGSTEQRRLVLVGARKIDLDLQIESYNDRSEFDYPRLKDLFEKRGKKEHEPKTGLESDSSRR